MPMHGKVNYGILGTASIAQQAHIPAATECRLSKIEAVASREKARALDTAARFGIPQAFGSYDELLKEDALQAVINSLPNSLHYEWTVKAAEAGKHILCEKPMAVTPAACSRMIDACRANDVLLYEGFSQHFNPVMDRVRELIREGAIGPVDMVRAELTYSMPDWTTDVRAQAALDGGALYDAGCYCINTVRAIMQAEPVQASGAERLHPVNQVDATFAGLLTFPGNRFAYISAGMEQPYRWPLEIIGSDGKLFVPDVFSGESLEICEGESRRIEVFTTVNRFALQLDHFSSAILEGTPLRAGPVDALNNAAVMAALKQSAGTGQTVPMMPVESY